MDIIFPDDGLVSALQQLVSGDKITYDLFVNDITPSLGDTISTYVLGSGASIPAVNVPTANWTFTSTVAHLGSIQSPPIVFTSSNLLPLTIYGYIAYVVGSGKLLLAARFDTSRTLNPGDTTTVTPIMGNFSGLSS